MNRFGFVKQIAGKFDPQPVFGGQAERPAMISGDGRRAAASRWAGG